jgi:hypothetical protein
MPSKAFSGHGFLQTRPFGAAAAGPGRSIGPPKADHKISCGQPADETILAPGRSRPETKWDCSRPNQIGGHVISTLENDSAHSEGWDPALWTIGTVIGVAILYVACLA